MGDTFPSRDEHVHSPLSSQSAQSLSDKSSAFAMWVGNIPGDATMAEAIDLFSNMDDASPIAASNTVSSAASLSASATESGVLSVFLMPQSHCAFVNYVDNDHLERGIKFFQGRTFRLKAAKMVCRVRDEQSRRSGPLAQREQNIHRQWVKSHTAREGIQSPTENDLSYESDSSSASTTSSLLSRYFPDRYFILKAMAQTDIQLSIGSRHWATQPKNEEVLNRAFRTSQNVWLIFGVNKSGQFSGFARMSGPIQSASENDLEWPPREPQLPPNTLVTQSASSFGYSIQQRSHPTVQNNVTSIATTPKYTQAPVLFPSASSSHSQPPVPNSQSSHNQRWTTPFKVEWICTDPLPFHQLRRLKNPWNRNLEVKVGRDGTELEPSVGKQLLGVWNQVNRPPPPSLYSHSPHGEFRTLTS